MNGTNAVKSRNERPGGGTGVVERGNERPGGGTGVVENGYERRGGGRWKRVALLLSYNYAEHIRATAPFLVKLYQDTFGEIFVYSDRAVDAASAAQVMTNVPGTNRDHDGAVCFLNVQRGCYGYAAIVDFAERHARTLGAFEGVFFLMDDCLLNCRLLERLDPRRAIGEDCDLVDGKLEQFEPLSAKPLKHWHWQWSWGRPAATGVMAEPLWRDLVGSDDRWAGQFADYAYVPTAGGWFRRFADLCRLMLKHHVFLEIAIPTALRHAVRLPLGPGHSLRASHNYFPAAIPWTKEDREAVTGTDAALARTINNNLVVHPLKFSDPTLQRRVLDLLAPPSKPVPSTTPPHTNLSASTDPATRGAAPAPAAVRNRPTPASGDETVHASATTTAASPATPASGIQTVRAPAAPATAGAGIQAVRAPAAPAAAGADIQTVPVPWWGIQAVRAPAAPAAADTGIQAVRAPDGPEAAGAGIQTAPAPLWGGVLGVRVAVVMTTIRGPTAAARAYMEKFPQVDLVVVGDRKTPHDAWRVVRNAFYLDPDTQRALFPALSDAIPWNTYARKNLGYAWCVARGYDVIVDTDDDTSPNPNWLKPLALLLPRAGSPAAGSPSSVSPSSVACDVATIESPAFPNVYRLFTDRHIWPRGFPVRLISADEPVCVRAPDSNAAAAAAEKPWVVQALVDGDPDVDALFRLTRPAHEITADTVREFRFKGRSPSEQGRGETGEVEWVYRLGRGVRCAFNSQNTYWLDARAFEQLYIPSTCTFRVCDILRSYVAQHAFETTVDSKLAGVSGGAGRVAFCRSTARQDRNPHDLVQDLVSEFPLYAHLDAALAAIAAGVGVAPAAAASAAASQVKTAAAPAPAPLGSAPPTPAPLGSAAPAPAPLGSAAPARAHARGGWETAGAGAGAGAVAGTGTGAGAGAGAGAAPVDPRQPRRGRLRQSVPSGVKDDLAQIYRRLATDPAGAIMVTDKESVIARIWLNTIQNARAARL